MSQPVPGPDPRPQPWTVASVEKLLQGQIKRLERKNKRQRDRIATQACGIAELRKRLYLLAEDAGKRECDLLDKIDTMLETAHRNDGEYHVKAREADTLRAAVRTLGDHIRQIAAAWESPDADGQAFYQAIREARAAADYHDYHTGPNDAPFPPKPTWTATGAHSPTTSSASPSRPPMPATPNSTGLAAGR